VDSPRIDREGWEDPGTRGRDSRTPLESAAIISGRFFRRSTRTFLVPRFALISGRFMIAARLASESNSQIANSRDDRWRVRARARQRMNYHRTYAATAPMRRIGKPSFALNS